MLNNSGAQRVVDDLMTLDATSDDAVTGIAVEGVIKPLWVVTDATINAGAQGQLQSQGEAVLAVQGAVTRGNYLRSSATAQKAEDTGVAIGSLPPPGTFAVAVTAFAGPGAGTITAMLLGSPVMYDGGYGLRGFQGDPNATTPNTKYDLTKADLLELRAPNGGVYIVKNVGVVTNDVSLDNTNPNGRDQAGVFGASSWIHFYYVLALTGPGVGTVRSRSSVTAPPTGPTLATGEIAWAYAGAVRFDGSSHLIPTYFRGAWAYYQARQEFLVLTSITLDGVEKTIGIGTVAPPNSLATQQLWYFFTRGDFGFKIRVTTGADFYAPPAGVGVDTPTDFYVTMIFPYVATNMIYLYANIGGTANVAASMQGYEMPNGGE